MKRTSLLLAALLSIGLAACGEQQKPAPKAPEAPKAVEAPKAPEAPKADAAAPAPEMKKEEMKKDEKK